MFNSIYIKGRDPGKLNITRQNGQSHHLKYHLQLKTKEVAGVVVWNFKAWKTIHMEIEKQMFGR